MTDPNYQNINFLTSGQRKIFNNLKKIEEAKKILLKESIGKEGYFASAVSLDGLNSKREVILTMLTDALTLTKALMNESLYNSNNSSETADLRTKVSNLVNNVQNVLNNSLKSDLTTKTVSDFAISLNDCFLVSTSSPASAVDNMVTYGVFAGVYKKVIGMMRNYNPYSRTSKAKKERKGLGEMGSVTEKTKPEFTTIARTLTDKTKDTQWIYNHINTSLPICCIDKLICIMNDTSSVHNLLGPHVKAIDKLNDVVGGSALSYFSFISFYFNYGDGQINDSQKLRPKISKDSKGTWIVKGVVYPERLNIDNEIKRSKKSITNGDGTQRAYDIYLIASGACKKLDYNTKGAFNAYGNMGYYTDPTELYNDMFQTNNTTGQVERRPPGDVNKTI